MLPVCLCWLLDSSMGIRGTSQADVKDHPGFSGALVRRQCASEGQERSSTEGIPNPISCDRQPWLRHQPAVEGVSWRGSNRGTSVRVSNARVIVVQATQHRGGDDSSRLCGVAFTILGWNALSDALMWPRAIEVIGVFLYHAAQVVSMEDEGVVKAVPSDAANTPFADSVGRQSRLHLNGTVRAKHSK